MKQIPTPNQIPAAVQEESVETISQVVQRVESLKSQNITDHVQAFEEAHRTLQEHLNEAAHG